MMKKGKNKGFTLIEAMVSIAIFSGISILLVNIFTSSVENENRIMQNQKLLDEATYSLEYMSKAITMAQPDGSSGSCTHTPFANFGIGADSISFLAHDTISGTYKCRRFFLADGAIQEQWSTDEDASNFQSATRITSTRINVEKLTFGVTGNLAGYQPRITILIDLAYNSSAENNPKISVQTSVSERRLNVTQ